VTKINLTDAVVDALEAPAKGQRIVRDEEVKGFAVRVLPSGTRAYFLDYTAAGKRRYYTIGTTTEWKCGPARKFATDLKGKIKHAGADPAEELKAEREEAERRARSAVTMTQLWDRYELEVVALNKPRTASEKKRMWTNRIEPALGKMNVQAVTDKDVGDVVRAPLTKDGRGKGEAGNLYRLLNHMFEKAEAWTLRPRALGNPLEHVTQPTVQRRERLLSDKEVASLNRVLEKCRADESEYPQIIAVIKAVMLTGARIGELLTLKWDDIRFEEKELHLEDTKTGHSRRPISAEACRLFKTVERMVGSDYVFRGIEEPTKPLGYDLVRKSFDRITEAAGVQHCTLHTLRHFIATKTANAVSNPRVGMRLTGHKSTEAYLRYVHGEHEQARELADKLGKQIGAIARKRGGQIVQLKPRKSVS
jgi:integrase